MMKNTMPSLVTGLACLMIFCRSTRVYENRYAWDQGWRIGKVTTLIKANEFSRIGGPRSRQNGTRPHRPSCRHPTAASYPNPWALRQTGSGHRLSSGRPDLQR